MNKIIKNGLQDRKIGILDVIYPDKNEWNVDEFKKVIDKELNEIKNINYDRDIIFRNNPYFRYFRKFKKSYPVMMQVESFLLKDRPFKEDNYINCIPFLSELKNYVLLGSHDADRIIGDVILFSDTEKTPFIGVGNRDVHSYPNDITAKDDKGIIFSMISGADDRTCLHDDTKHVIYIIFGVPGISDDDIIDVKNQLTSYINVLAPNSKINFNIY